MIKKISHLPLPASSITHLNYFSSLDELLIFDIETTGFSRTQDTVISITSLIFSRNEMTCIQWFAETPSEEFELLKDAAVLFNEKPIHMTYNGHAFDIPFLNCKYQYYSISASLNKSKTYDLYRICRKALQLDSYKLKAIEIALGIERKDEISGKACVELYAQYLAKERDDVPELILLHNYEDVVNLVALTSVVEHISNDFELFRIHYLNYNNVCYYLSESNIHHDLTSLKFWAHDAQIHSAADNTRPYEYYYANGESVKFHIEGQSLYVELIISTHRTTLNEFAIILLNEQSLLLNEVNPQLVSSPASALFRINEIWEHDNLMALLESLLLWLIK